MGNTRFSGRCALVSGAAAGIGAAVAQRLAAEGATVIGIDTDASVTDAGLGGAVVGDVADESTWEEAVRLAISLTGRVDVLVSNAHTVVVRPLTETEPADWRRQVDVNLTASYLALRHCLPQLRRHRGSVILVSSVHALAGLPGHPAYAACKGALLSLARQVAVEYGPEVRVNAVLPGPILTAAWDRVAEPDRARSAAATALGRLGTPDEVAAPIAFLASDEAAYVTGTSLVIDGGWAVRKDSA